MFPRQRVDPPVVLVLAPEVAQVRQHFLGEELRALRHLVARGAAGITPVSLGFLYMGAWRTASGRDLREVRDLELALVFLPFRPRAARFFGILMARLRASGRDVGAEDAMIAAIALDLDLRVITRDVAHFSRIAGLAVETY